MAERCAISRRRSPLALPPTSPSHAFGVGPSLSPHFVGGEVFYFTEEKLVGCSMLLATEATKPSANTATKRIGRFIGRFSPDWFPRIAARLPSVADCRSTADR